MMAKTTHFSHDLSLIGLKVKIDIWNRLGVTGIVLRETPLGIQVRTFPFGGVVFVYHTSIQSIKILRSQAEADNDQ